VWSSAASNQPAARAELGARALTIRVYAVNSPQGVRVLPGGLARVANEAAADVVSTQRGGGAKDVWVLSAGTAEEPEPASQSGKWASYQRQDYIPSRLVENLYWLGRYTVRSENTARLLLRTISARSDSLVWQHAGQLCRDLGAAAQEQDLLDALRSRDAQGLQSDVRHLAWCASQVRNRLSARYWRGVVGLQRQMQEAVATRGSSREVYERVLLSLAALTGFSEEDMMHDEGWRLMRLGRRIERLQFVANILARQLGSAQATRPETVEWLLDVCDSTPIYRARYAGPPRLSQMLNLLLYDDGHPMALVFLRRAIDRDLDELARSLSGERERGVPDVPLLPMGAAEQLDAAGPAGAEARAGLADSLLALSGGAAELSDRLSRRYFALIEADSHALAS
jgi:uncharacterized alpha-E superfamily protein